MTARLPQPTSCPATRPLAREEQWQLEEHARASRHEVRRSPGAVGSRLELSATLEKLGQTSEAASVLEDALRWHDQVASATTLAPGVATAVPAVQILSALVELHDRTGDPQAAEHDRQRLRVLARTATGTVRHAAYEQLRQLAATAARRFYDRPAHVKLTAAMPGNHHLRLRQVGRSPLRALLPELQIAAAVLVIAGGIAWALLPTTAPATAPATAPERAPELVAAETPSAALPAHAD